MVLGTNYVETTYFKLLSNDDIFAWTANPNAGTFNFPRVSIMRGISSGSPVVTGRYLLPGASNSTSKNLKEKSILNFQFQITIGLGWASAAILPNDSVALIGVGAGFFQVNFLNDLNMSAAYVNLTDTYNILNVAAIEIIGNDTSQNITILFVCQAALTNALKIIEGTIIPGTSGAIVFGRSVTNSVYAGNLLGGVLKDQVRKVAYIRLDNNLFVLNLTTWTLLTAPLPQPFNNIAGSSTTNWIPTLSQDRTKICMSLADNAFVLDVSNLPTIK